MRRATASRARRITRQLLRGWPLPVPDGDGDKTTRGRLLIVGGSAEVPGAAMLAADAALRAGAGKVCIATEPAVAAGIAIAIPEARVVAVGAGRRGYASVAEEAEDFDALVAGPGITTSRRALHACVGELASRIAPAVVDAGALDLWSRGASSRASGAQFVLTPHLGEMAHLTGCDKDEVEANAAEIALDYAASHRAVVALKGASTFIADPDGALWVHDKVNVGLAISGSGDVLAGIIGALAARGASCAQAAVWGVALHAQAGRRLVSDHGMLGGLARELPGYVPAALREFGSK